MDLISSREDMIFPKFASIDQVQILTKEVTKLRNVLKNMPKISSGGGNYEPVGKFAKGGRIPGNSTTGDRVLALVNSGEYILNRNQMSKLGKALGGKSASQVFQFASGRTSISGKIKNGIQAFASGGFVKSVLPNVISGLSGASDSVNRNRLNKFNRLLHILQDSAISDSDVDRLINRAGLGSKSAMDKLSALDIDNLINAFGKIKRSSAFNVPPHNFNGSSKEGSMFGEGATILKNLQSNTASPAAKSE